MQLVDQPAAKILTHRLDATADLHVAALGSELRLLQRSLDTVGHEDEGGAAVHLDRIARMVRQHEGRRVIGWIVAPPAFPALAQPGTADRPEHIAAEDERAEPAHRTTCVGLIDAVRAAVLTGHCPEHARTEHPLVQLLPTLAERIFKTLLRPCSEPVERDREARNAHFRHNETPPSLPASRIEAVGVATRLTTPCRWLFWHVSPTDRFPEKHVFGPEIGQSPQRPNYRRCQVRSNATEPRTAPPPELAAMLCEIWTYPARQHLPIGWERP